MIDEKTIRKWWDIFVTDLVEVRVLGQRNYSGYYRSVDNVIRDLRTLREEKCQVYFTPNRLNDGCYSRDQREHLVMKPKATTSDNDIVWRDWLLVDIDPKRPTDVSSSEAERNAAHETARKVFRGLKSAGFPAPVVCMSGNGWHLVYKVDMPNDNRTLETVKGFMKILQDTYGGGVIDIDQKVVNAARICKLYGTEARKGTNSPERPWRMSKIVYVPNTIKTLPAELLEAYVAQYTIKEEHPVRSQSAPFSLQDFIDRHHIKVTSQKTMTDGRVVYNLAECPFDSSHKDGDACLMSMPSGAVAFKCFHNSCSGHGWSDFRKLYEPDYARREEQWHQQAQPFQGVQDFTPAEPKEENDKDGKKWLDFSEVEMVDTSKMEKILTGFPGLDAFINGMYMSELVILSGRAGAGKSSWINTLILNVIEQGYKVAMWSGELPPHIVKLWLYNAAAGSLVRKDEDGDTHLAPEYVSQIDEWIRGRVMLYNNNYGYKWSQVFADMSLAADAGARMFILDNLMTLDIDLLTDGKYEAQKEVISTLKDFAAKRSAVVMLVCHPRKVTSFIRNEDISGSSDIVNKADDIFIIHRVNLDFYRRGREYLGEKRIKDFATEGKDGIILNEAYQGNVVEISKNRMHGNIDNLVGLYYHVKSRRFLDRTDCLGMWEKDGKPAHVIYSCRPYSWYKGTLPDPTAGYTMVTKDDKEKKPQYNVDTMSPESREIHSMNDVSDNMEHLQPQLIPFNPPSQDDYLPF